MIRKFLLFLVFLLLIFIPTKSYFHEGFPYTHDGENHLARFANYKIALKEGQFPPRFAPNLMSNYGYPVFNYNYPLANILSLPFSYFKINYEVTFKLLAITFVIIGMAGIVKWLELLNFKQTAIWFGLSVYSLNPYLISLIAYRGNIGEIAALGLLPVVFYFVERNQRQKAKNQKILNLLAILTLTAFLLSHNVTVLFAIPLIILYAVIRYQKNWQAWRFLFFLMTYSLLLSLWFWLPAIAEKNQTILDNANLSVGFANHFVTFHQLLFSPLRFGFSFAGNIDTLPVSLGLLNSFVVIASCFWIIKNRKILFKLQHFLKSAILTLVMILLFLQLEASKIIWLNFPLVNYIQFPWRLGLFVAIFMPFVAANLWQESTKKLKIILIILVSLQVIISLKIKPVDYFHKLNRDYDAFGQNTSTASENLPKSFTFIQLAWQPSAQVLSGQGEIITHYWTGSQRTYLVKANNEVVIVEPSMNFLGWFTKDLNTGQTLNHLDNEIIGGRIAYTLPAGEHLIQSEFTQKTWARRLGNFISLATLIGLILYSCIHLLMKKRTK